MADKYVSLKEVVSMCLDETNKSIKDFDKMWGMGFRALTKLNYSFAAEPKSVRLPVGGNKTVPLPSDYAGSWSKIGVLNTNGEVCALKVNNGLSIFRDNNPNRLTAITGDVNTGLGVLGIPFYNYFYNGTYYNLFGAGQQGLVTYGDCRVDERNNVIVLSPDFQYPDIILEYMTNPQMDDDYQVPIVLQEAVIAFIQWKLKLNTEQNFYAEAIEARRNIKPVTKQEINEVIRLSSGQYLKA